MGYLEGLHGHRQADRSRPDGHRRSTPRRSGPSPSASTAATSSTATRTAWRSASAASCAPASARPAASTCAAPTTRPTRPVSPGERYGFVYEINYLRCIHCDLCVEACPTEAITESKLFEFSFTNRDDAIYTKAELLVDDDGKPQHLPWEDWREGDDRNTSGWMRATVAGRQRRLRGPAVCGRASSATACARPSGASPIPTAADVPADWDISVREIGAASCTASACARRPAPSRATAATDGRPMADGTRRHGGRGH